MFSRFKLVILLFLSSIVFSSSVVPTLDSVVSFMERYLSFELWLGLCSSFTFTMA